MVRPLTVLKILHCRNLCNNPNKSKKDTKLKKIIKRQKYQRYVSDNTSHDNIDEVVKNETKTELCRVCLNHGTIPIHGENPNEDLADAISNFGGIEINVFDFYPKYLCQSCHALLQGAILFKKTAQASEERLKKNTEPDPYINDDFIDTALDNATESSAFIDKQKAGLACKQCDIQFETFQEYEHHRLSEEHENLKKICSICNKMYIATYLKKHMELHTRKIEYICDVCGKYFSILHKFKRHRLTHFYSLPFQCSLCPYKGRFPESLKMHMRSHTGEKPYICDECPQKRFISKSNLNRHMLTHKMERDYKCECGRGYYTKREFDMHFKVEHGGIKEHHCQMCGKAFGYRKQLMKHQLKVHKREKLGRGRMPLYLKIESMKQQENHCNVVL